MRIQRGENPNGNRHSDGRKTTTNENAREKKKEQNRTLTGYYYREERTKTVHIKMLSQGRKNNEFKDCTDRHTDVHVRPQSLCLINMATSPTPNILAPVHCPRNPTGLVRTLVPLPTSLREIASFRRSVELPKGRQLSGSMTGECRRQRVFISTSSPGGVGRARLRLVWRQCGVIRTLCPLPPRLLLGSSHTHIHC